MLHALVTDWVVGGVARTHMLLVARVLAPFTARDKAGHEAAEVDHVFGSFR